MNQTSENLFYSAQQAHQSSDLLRAEALYKQVLNADPNHAGALQFLGVLYGQQKRYDESIQYLHKAYKTDQKNPQFCNNLAEAFRRRGDLDEAITFFKKALDIAPNFVEAYYSLGLVYREKGDIEEARKYYQKALSINPRHANSYQNLGNILLAEEKYEEALDCFNRSLSINPNQANSLNNIAIVLSKTGKNEEALEYYKQAVRLNPRFIEAYNNWGSLLVEMKRSQEAANCFASVLRIDPKNINALMGLASIKISLGNLGEALDIYEKVTRIEPDNANAFNIMGSLFTKVSDHEMAIKSFKRALEIQPDFEPALLNLAVLLEKHGNITEAGQYYKKLLQLQPDNDLLKLQYDIISPVIPQSNAEIDQARKHISETLDKYIEKEFNFDINKYNTFTGQSFFMMTYQGRDNDKELREKFVKVFQKYFPENEPVINNNEIKHIGFLVSEGHEFVFNKSVAGMLNNFSKGKYRYTVICDKVKGEKVIKPNITNPEIGYLDLPVNLQEAVAVVKEAKFDILNFWEVGTDSMNFFLAFYKLAPIQTLSWGWPITSGNPKVDYYISSEHLEVPEGDVFYTEKLFNLKYLPTYYYRPKVPTELKPRSYFNLSEDVNIYFCSQTLLKVHPDFDQAVKQILEKDPSGIVLFLKDRQKHIDSLIEKRLNQTCSEVISRIRLMDRMPFEEYLNLVAVADVIIDPFHYAGANTTYDAFAAKRPVVTLPTKYHRGRYSYAAYMEMEMSDCIASDPQDFVEKAVKLGTDKQYNQEISKKIVERCPVLFENIGVIHEYERFFAEAIENLGY
jgi:protein O-GlcNAc transferase